MPSVKEYLKYEISTRRYMYLCLLMVIFSIVVKNRNSNALTDHGSRGVLSSSEQNIGIDINAIKAKLKD